jgi:L-lactate dehydrogenase complex protein LldG
MSGAAREEILNRLRSALGRGQVFRAASADAPPAAPSTVADAEGDARTLALTFGARLAAVSGSFEIVDGQSEVPERVLRRVTELAAATASADAATGHSGGIPVLSWAPAQLPLPELAGWLAARGVRLVVPDDLHDPEDRARAAAPAVGLTGADAAFAATGSLLLTAAPGRSRAASLLPLAHVALVPLSRIYPSFEAWARTVRREGHLDGLLRSGAQAVFITGPSKSADIELNLTLGVHGPRFLHAILFHDR